MIELRRIGSFKTQQALNLYQNKFKIDIPLILANMILNHFLEGFRLGGHRTDTSLRGWKPRQFTRGKGERAILVKRGLLRRDIKKRMVNFTNIVVGTSSLTSDYASIHNEGGRIPITRKMRGFFWYMSHISKSEGEKNYWKNLALHRGTYIDMPKREFIGNSKMLERQMDRRITIELDKIFK